MKRFVTAGLVSSLFLFAGVAHATTSETYNAVVGASNRLVTLQNANGSWDWIVTGAAGPTSQTFLNITGVTAEGLLSAYGITGNSAYLDAAKKAGDFIVSTIDASSPKSINGYNLVFLKKLSDVSGVSTYANKASAYFSTLYSATPTTLCASGCVDTNTLVTDEIARRGAAVTPDGIVPWDLASYVEYAALVGDTTHAAELEAASIAFLNQPTYISGIGDYDLGLSAGLKAAALLGDTANVSAISGRIASADGSYGTDSDGKRQATSYMLAAFVQASDSRSTASASYLTSAFNSTVGGWIETDSTEYSEADSEIVTALALTLPKLQSTQTGPDGSGNATVTADAPQVVVTSPTQSVNITVGDDVSNSTVNVSALLTTPTTATLPEITVQSADADVSIPASTIVTSSDAGWGGVITAPTITTAPGIPNADNVVAVEIGAGNTALTFSNAVKLVFAGQAGKLAGWSRGGAFTPIADVCNDPTNPTLTGDDCRIDVVGDLVIWTKHFTVFTTYTQTGGASSGGSSTPSGHRQDVSSLIASNAGANQGEVLGAFTGPVADPASVALIKTQVILLIKQLIAMLQDQLAAAVAAGQY